MKVAVIYGGKSAEREVSLMSGKEITKALADFGYVVCGLDLTDDIFAELQSFVPDVVFIGLHGRLGEDGTVQGALELLGYPYVGSGVLASALAMDKRMTKKVLSGTGIVVAKDIMVARSGQDPTADDAERLGAALGWPMIIKPNREGSTIGLTLAHDKAEALAGLQLALTYDTEVLAEQYIQGTEVTAVVLGDAHAPHVLEVIEIIPKAELYDYDSKYTAGNCEHIMPARISEEHMGQVQEAAILAYSQLGCRDYARVDFIIGDSGPVLLEVNTLPGMTATSLVPDAARSRGLSFGAFLDRLIQQVYQRAHIG